MRARVLRRPLWVALSIGTVFLVIEVVGALLTGSLALLADAGHMLADVGAIGLGLFAFWISGRPATPERTFGYLRVEILAAALNAASLVAISVLIFWEAGERFADPPPVATDGMIAVAVAGLLANLAMAWVLGHSHGENLNLRGAFLHVLGDLLGSVGVLAAALMILLTGWLVADPVASVAIGMVTLWSGWRLLREAVDVLLEATPRSLDTGAIGRALRGLEGVNGVHDLHVWTVTSGFLALSAHLTTATAEDHHDLLHRASDLLRERFGITHATLQIEAPHDVDEACCIGPICAPGIVGVSTQLRGSGGAGQI